MLSLHQKLPTSVEINGKDYEIDMSFDNILHILDMLKDKRLSQVAKVMTGVKMLFKEMPSDDLKELIEIWTETFNHIINPEGPEDDFEYDIKGNKMPKIKEVSEKLMDLKQDGNLIYTSFLQDYKIDLFDVQGELHWFKFITLLNNLSDSTALRKIIEIRSMPLPSGKGSQEHRKQVEKMKKRFKLKEDEVI